jgi:hypothetical protein
VEIHNVIEQWHPVRAKAIDLGLDIVDRKADVMEAQPRVAVGVGVGNG